MFKDMFQSSDDSPIYQLKNITQKSMESDAGNLSGAALFRKNIEQGIAHLVNINIESYVHFIPYFQH
jgi:hypothetical protein